MGFPKKEIVEKIRKEYPVGCEVVLDRMEDVQAPPVGTHGIVKSVDDTGSIKVAWHTGGSLRVVYGEDACHRIDTDMAVKEFLDDYGKTQTAGNCPHCGSPMPHLERHAVSRRAHIIVCDLCGTEEALEDAGMSEKKPLFTWAAWKEAGKHEGR